MRVLVVRRAVALCLLGVLLLQGLAGCGGGGTDVGGSSPAASEPGADFAGNAAPLATLLDALRRPVAPQAKAQEVSGLAVLDVVGTLVEVYLSALDAEQIDSIEAEVKETREQLRGLSTQVSQLQSALASLEKRMDLQLSNLLNEIVSADARASLTRIETAYGDGTANSMAYYLDKTGRLDTTDSANLAIFVTNVLDRWALSHHVNVIYRAMVPDTDSTPLLDAYVDKLVARMATRPERASDDLLTSYLLLEQYFLKLMAQQAQGAVIVANCWNRRDGVDAAAENACGPNARVFLEGYRTKVEEEVRAFQAATTRLLVKTALPMDRAAYEQDFALFCSQGGPFVTSSESVRAILARHRFFCQMLSEQRQFGASLFLVATADTPVTAESLAARPAGVGSWRSPKTVETFPVGGPRYVQWLDDTRFTDTDQWSCYAVSFETSPSEAGAWEFRYTPPGGGNPRMLGNATVGLRNEDYEIESAPGARNVPYGLASLSWRWGPQNFTPWSGKWVDGSRFQGQGAYNPAFTYFTRIATNPSVIQAPGEQNHSFGPSGFQPFDSGRPLSLSTDMWPPLGRYLTLELDLRLTRDVQYVGQYDLQVELVARHDGALVNKSGFWSADPGYVSLQSCWRNLSTGASLDLVEPVHLVGWGGWHEVKRDGATRSFDATLAKDQWFRVDHWLHQQTYGTNTAQWWNGSLDFRTLQILVKPR